MKQAMNQKNHSVEYLEVNGSDLLIDRSASISFDLNKTMIQGPISPDELPFE